MPQGPAPEHADVVVVGSGFGGSVAAYRLAEAGRSVVVLERGKAYPPGSFPRSPTAVGRNFWEPEAGRHGLFDVWSFDGIDSVVSSGLGGGSLIYANVLLRKDEKWFVHEQPLPHGGYERWPVARADLEPHYDVVEQMIGVSPYPYPDTPKTKAVREAAIARGLDVLEPPLAVSFSRRRGEDPVPLGEIETPAYGNLHGLPRVTCRGCGECDLGCNYGSKNTLDHTYLSAARHHGADLRVRHEVKGFRPLDTGGYEVVYVVHTAEDGEPAADLPSRTITCDRLVLAAGTFGTTNMLLRNRSALPGIGAALGTRFTGNGDLLGLVMNATRDGRPRELESGRGPVITTAVRVGDSVDGVAAGGRGHYVEDAGYPSFGAWLAEASQSIGMGWRAGTFALDRMVAKIKDDRDTSIGAELAILLGAASLSGSSLPLLGMGRDIPDGVLSLRDGELCVDWTTDTSMDYFEGVRAPMRELAEEMGGRYHDNPLWWADRVITVHPLGGAPMGRHPGEGVCDPFGEVYGHPGLHVMDGAVMPGPVGANPSLTIAALADRACTRLLESPSRAACSRPGVDGPQPAREAAVDETDTGTRSGLRFTEQMKGFAALAVDDPQAGFDAGRRDDQRLMFELTISVDDVDRFVADPEHTGLAEGYVEADFLGGRFDVERGWFNLFVLGEGDRDRRMLYRLWLAGPGGNQLTFIGRKEVHDDPGFDLWRDTSTHYVRIVEGHLAPGDDDGPVMAAGIITIHIPDFMKQMTTFRTWGPHRLHALKAFNRLFLGELYDVYGALASDDEDAQA
jgi:cholesterol oxidase